MGLGVCKEFVHTATENPLSVVVVGLPEVSAGTFRNPNSLSHPEEP